MSTYFVCPICGANLECKGPHEARDQTLGGVKECPLKKGAIYVFVKDDRGAGVAKVRTVCKGKPADTDQDGFAFFEHLEEGPYSTGIRLEESDASVRDNHYAVVRTEVEATVQRSKITLVEFQIHRYAALDVEVKRTDNQKFFGNAMIRVEATVAADSPPEPEKPSLESGPVRIAKLRPTGTYRATAALDAACRKNFKISGEAEHSGLKVKPDGPNKIEFWVDPVYWIKFALVDQKSGPVSGDLMLQHSAWKDPAVHQAKSESALEVNDLPAGTMTVHKVTPQASCEFVSCDPSES